ncbi:MAG: hypothetical protein WBZ08_18395, partial [Pseudolabrys sp.]
RNREAGKGHEMTNDHKLAKRAHKLGYRYITRWPVPTTGTEHILEHKDGDRHFRSMDEVECFIGEQEIAKLERQTGCEMSRQDCLVKRGLEPSALPMRRPPK